MTTNIYDFEAVQPPALTKKELVKELERRKLEKQITVLRIASVFLSLILLLFALFIMRDSAVIAYCSLGLLCISLVGNGVISAVFFNKRRSLGKEY